MCSCLRLVRGRAHGCVELHGGCGVELHQCPLVTRFYGFGASRGVWCNVIQLYLARMRPDSQWQTYALPGCRPIAAAIPAWACRRSSGWSQFPATHTWTFTAHIGVPSPCTHSLTFLHTPHCIHKHHSIKTTSHHWPCNFNHNKHGCRCEPRGPRLALVSFRLAVRLAGRMCNLGACRRPAFARSPCK